MTPRIEAPPDRLRYLLDLQRQAAKIKHGITRYYDDPVGFAYDCIDWGDGEGLTEYQEEVLDSIPRRKRVAVRGPHGLGKALELSVRIPTPSGWSTIGDLRVGDEVFDEHGKPCQVTAKSPVWTGDTYEVEFADGSVITAHGEHEWNAVDVYHRPKTPKPDRKPIPIADWRDHWAATRRVTTAYMAEHLHSPGGQLRWRIPTARPLELPSADLPVDPYIFGYWLGDGKSAAASVTVHETDWPSLQERLAVAQYHHGRPRSHKNSPSTLSVTISSQPVRRGGGQHDSLQVRLRDLGVLGYKRKHIPMVYKRASIAQRIEMVRGLWDSDGYRQAGGCDEITLTCKPLAADVAEVLRSLGLAVRVSESDSKLNGRVVGRRWRIAARFDFNPYRLPRYNWEPRGAQASRHTQRTITDIRKVADKPTQCIEVDSPSHLYLAGDSMIPTHNSGIAAIAVHWFALTRDAAGVDWKIPCTAGSWHQLTQYLFPEIHKWAGRLRWDKVRDGRPFSRAHELQNLNLRLAHGSAFAGASANAALIEGAHADSLMFLFDEGKAIPSATFDACEGALGGTGEAFALVLSTPGAPSGRFYDICARKAGYEDWHPVHVTLERAIAARRISKEWAEQRRRQWGRESAIYQNRVEGEFYASDEDSVIPLAWAEAAVARWHEWKASGDPVVGRPRTVGVDVARTGQDRTVLAIRNGPVVTELRRFTREDTMTTTGRVKAVLDLDDSRTAVVDVIGIGAGVFDRLKEQGARAVAFNAAKGTKLKDSTREFGFANCLTGDARVTPVGSLRRIYRSRYEGTLFKIETAGGDQFTATPNHQVLTARGWVPVQSLNVGDQLCDSSVRNAPGATVQPEVDDVPPQLSEVYRAADILFGSERVQRHAVNFHGDRPSGEIDVVTVDRGLFARWPAARQHPEHDPLIRFLVLAGHFSGLGPLPHPGGITDGNAREGTVFPRDDVLATACLPLRKGELVVDEVISLKDASLGDFIVGQNAVNDVSGHPHRRGDGIRGLSGRVPLDNGPFVNYLAGQSPGLCRGARLDAALSQDPADNVSVHAGVPGEGVDGNASLIALDDLGGVHLRENGQPQGFDAPPWLDSVFVKDLVNGGPVSPEKLSEGLHRCASLIMLDEVISIERTQCPHDGPFVYTLETSTGAYRSSNIVHQNCRSAAWWTLREALDPSGDPDICLPDDEMLLGDLSAPKWDVTSSGRIQVEGKDGIRERIGRSTDDGDACVMAFVPHLGDGSPGTVRRWAGAQELTSSGMSEETRAHRKIREIRERVVQAPAEAPWDLDGFSPQEERSSCGNNVRSWG